jgi:exodeoxyribonuclease III
MERLDARAAALIEGEACAILAGDYNVIPQGEDCRNPAAWAEDALFLPETRAAYRRVLHLGYTDAVRLFEPGPEVYTFWDYQAGAWQKNNGIRIDHILLTPQAADRVRDARIDKHVRGWEKPSDHVPVWVDLAA